MCAVGCHHYIIINNSAKTCGSSWHASLLYVSNLELHNTMHDANELLSLSLFGKGFDLMCEVGYHHRIFITASDKPCACS